MTNTITVLSFLSIISQECAERSAGVDSFLYLPSYNTKKDLHAQYSLWCRSVLDLQPAQCTWFKRVWKEQFSNLKIRKKEECKCGTCVILISGSPEETEQEKQIRLGRYKEHQEQVAMC
jgi:hypothetical protein